MEFSPVVVGLALTLCAWFLTHRGNRVVREARHEFEQLRDALFQSYGETQLALRAADGYRQLLEACREHYARCNLIADEIHARDLKEQAAAQEKRKTRTICACSRRLATPFWNGRRRDARRRLAGLRPRLRGLVRGGGRTRRRRGGQRQSSRRQRPSRLGSLGTVQRMTKSIWIRETVGLHGFPVLFQWAVEDGPYHALRGLAAANP